MESKKRFRAIFFDWDGTAVSDRLSECQQLVSALESALCSGIICAVITGTRIESIEKQCLNFLSAEAKRNLSVCANRGSEVYRFDQQGRSELVFRRVASPSELASLDRAAEAARKLLAEEGIETQVIYDRLNRRKIDLIPTAEWSSPKKNQVLDLLRAVQERIGGSHFKGGLREIFERVMELAHREGVLTPKVTSDIKHIEIGLTDKSDSAIWLRDHILAERDIDAEDVALVGDEFGQQFGLPGSDSLMRVAGFESATLISVGSSETATSVPGLLSWGGGPETFIRFLQTQALLPPILSFSTDPSWRLELEGFVPARSGEMEAIFSIGNGYLGARAGLSFGLPSSQDDLFIAGIYDQKSTRIPYLETVLSHERIQIDSELVPFPSPFFLSICSQGKELALPREGQIHFRRLLDLRSAQLSESLQFKPADDFELSLKTTRLASLADPHLLIQSIELHAEGKSWVELDASLEWKDLTENHPHLVLLSRQKLASIEEVVFQTHTSKLRLVWAARLFVRDGAQYHPLASFGKIPVRNHLKIWKLVSVFSDRDCADPERAALVHCESFSAEHIPELLAEHQAAWKRFWAVANLEYADSPALTQAQRFGAYHLRIATDSDPKVSMGARGLTGRAYEGHVFWDAEIFTFPFYLHTQPELAKNLLLYRYNTLSGARRRALQQSCQGASYAWESTLSGEDVTPESLIVDGVEVPIFTGKQQIHITGDVALAIHRYWNVTEDLEFLQKYGMEMLLEIARFWASRITWRGGQFHLDQVVGPDEYHHSVNDNAYTNTIAQASLQYTLEFCELLSQQAPVALAALFQKLKIEQEEITSWRKIQSRFFIPRPNDKGVIEQFAGFFDLEEGPVGARFEMRAPIGRLYDWKRVNQLKVLKQADVLMLPYLFPDRFSREVISANYDFYEPLTEHSSSLSSSVHAAIAFRAGNFQAAERFWSLSRDLDLKNLMKNTSLGVHLGAMGGAWQTLVFHFLGLRFEGDEIQMKSLSGRCPIEALNGIRLKVFYRGKFHEIISKSSHSSSTRSTSAI